MQVDSFKDFSPDESAAAAAEPQDEGHAQEQEPQADSEPGSGGNFPAHRVEGLPALSPTMSQGAAIGKSKLFPSQAATGSSDSDTGAEQM